MSGPALLRCYAKVIRALQLLPQESEYRIITTQLIKERQQIVMSCANDEDIEKKLGSCEKLINQANHEHDLAETMRKHEPWKPLEDIPPENQWKWPM